MSDEVCKTLAEARTGFVEAPAGCGKTEAIVRAIGLYCKEPQLVLTHTHAGVDALKQRFRDHGVPTDRYHVDTISGWAWSWVRRYPGNSRYRSSLTTPAWNDVYKAVEVLLDKDFVKNGILNSYAGIIIDEYQDCTLSMHRLVQALKGLVPCRVLGDDLQGIFDFKHDDPLVDWTNVKNSFVNDLGKLEKPFRWLKANNKRLGDWLLAQRSTFRLSREPNYDDSPIERYKLPFGEIGRKIIGLTREREGRICVIGPKERYLAPGLETTLAKQGYCVLEPNELRVLRDLVDVLAEDKPADKANALLDFFKLVYGGVSDHADFIAKICRGDPQRPRSTARKALCLRHSAGITPELIMDLLSYLERSAGVSCKRQESVSTLRCILEQRIQTGADIKELYTQETSRRKYRNRANIRRSIGSTLLVKGLEFEHAIVVRPVNWQKNWGGYKDLYVALTRGTKTVTILEYTN